MPPTVAVVRKRKNFFFAESGTGVRQSDFDAVMDNADIDVRSALSEPAAPSTERTRETIYDCDNVHIIREEINSQVDRWIISYPATAQQLAKRLAFAKGAAAAPTGTPADEIQTATDVNIDGGAAPMTFDFEGKTDTTSAIDWDASAAEYQAALEELNSIGAGNVSVSGSLAAGLVVTFIGRLAKANVPLITFGAGFLDGATPVTPTFVQSTAGANNLHLITLSASDVLPEFNFFTGWLSVSSSFKRHVNAVINRVTLTIPRRKLAAVEIEILASSDTQLDPTFTVPACIIPDPVKAADCRVQEDGDWITGDVEQIVYEFNNNVAIDDNLFGFDGIDIVAPERAEQFIETVRIQIQGSEADAFYQDAKAELEKPVVMYIGRPGERVVITMPLVSLKLDSGITFNTAGDSVISVTGQPHKDPTLGTYSKAEYHGAQTVAFLTT
jgi:hypothetical protein